MQPVKVRVSPSGRVSLPAEFRRTLGLEKGGTVVMTLDEGDIRIRTVSASVRRAQAAARELLAKSGKTLTVDEFLAERRADWDG